MKKLGFLYVRVEYEANFWINTVITGRVRVTREWRKDKERFTIGV